MKDINKIRFDVGCAATAPNSAQWILDDPNTKVFAFEPDIRSYNILLNGFHTNQYKDKPRLIKKQKIIIFKKKILKKIYNKNFTIYNCGIDNVSKKIKKYFYHTAKKNYGCSSLLKPISQKLGITTEFKKLVDIYPLNFFLKNINSKYIEMLKTDTQGNDLNVLKSAKNYIKKIAFVQSEYWALKDYEGEKNKLEARSEIIEYMKKKNFYCYYYTDVDIFFVNKKLKKIIKKNNIIDNCLDFPNGLYQKSLWFNEYDGKMKAYCFFRDFVKFLIPKKILNFTKRFFY